MAKPITAMVKLQCNAGAATPAPPVGPALGQHGINIMEFCKQFNARTQASTASTSWSSASSSTPAPRLSRAS